MTYALNEEDEYTGAISGAERELWCQVILQAFEDLKGSGKNGPPTANDAYRAAMWFKEDGKDFREVCSLAGVDSDAVRKKAMEIIEERNLLARPSHAPVIRRLEPEVESHKATREVLQLTLNGESHTLAEWSEKTGIVAGTIRDRLGYGWSVERALTEPTAAIFTALGESHTLTEWSGKTGIPAKTLRQRLSKGMHLERALTEPVDQKRSSKKPKSAEPITAFGETLTIAEWSRKKGLSYAVLAWRLSNGWPPERALTEPVSGLMAQRKRLGELKQPGSGVSHY